MWPRINTVIRYESLIHSDGLPELREVKINKNKLHCFSHLPICASLSLSLYCSQSRLCVCVCVCLLFGG